MRRRRPSTGPLAVVLALGVAGEAQAQVAVESCPVTSEPVIFAESSLDTGTEIKDGVLYDAASAGLRLQQTAGLFKSTPLGIADLTVFTGVADFDGDGWDDFVGVGEATSFVRIYRNFTFESPAPDWTDPDAIRIPEFRAVRELAAATDSHRWRPTAAGDFNGDGKPDVFRATAQVYGQPYMTSLWLNLGNDVDGNPLFLDGYPALATGTVPEDLGTQTWGGTNIVVSDYNGDRKLDLLVGNGDDGGSIRVFLNDCTLSDPLPDPLPPADQPLPCSDAPQFAYSTTMISELGFGGGPGSLPVFAYKDFDGDGRTDLIVGAPSCCDDASQRLRLFKGVDGGGLAATPSQSIEFVGAATSVLAADFSRDGKLDLVLATDNWHFGAGSLGGDAFYYVNDGSSTPFPDPPTTQLTGHADPALDYDVGLVFNYDNDPSSTPDLILADGNQTTSFYVLANRMLDQYVACGTVASGVLPLGDLADTEMVVTAARLAQVSETNGGSVTFSVSNEDPANWVPATPCPDASGDLCASFPKPVGRKVRWKAEVCSNVAHSTTPRIDSVELTYDYTRSREHYRAGVVVNDGVAYVGGFRQPGDRGHFYALNAGLDQTYWDAAAKLDAAEDEDRNIFTATRDGATRLAFTTAAADDADLLDTLDATDATQAAAVIAWVRSRRFGIGNDDLPQSRLGAVETSTPAVVTRPGLPIWYTFGSPADRADADTFIAANASRRALVLFGAKDGMIHAINTDPTDILGTNNGTEAWAIIPPKVAGGMLRDYTASMGDTTRIEAFPDGSPTVADFRRPDGSFGTVAVVASGNGGNSVFAFDVTRTIDADGDILGPTPMWTGTPGEAEAGQAMAKPAIARVLVAGVERWALIAGTGVAFDNQTAPYLKGRVVVAYDLVTGEVMWRFRAACPLTSDITVLETDDDLELGAPTLNGYADRAVFADRCGNVYKLDPARDLDGGWNDNTGLGAIDVGEIDDVPQFALFSTATTTGALGASSPIAGTIGATTDSSTRMVLFFGTGGLENHPASETNEFYAVYADTGEVRSKLAGACADGVCEKFYGGVVVTQNQVLMTRTIDPRIGTGTCDPGSSTIEALTLEADAEGEFDTEFESVVTSAVMSGLYGDANALYFATLGGEVMRIGEPRSAEAGGDTAKGIGGGRPPNAEGDGDGGGPMSFEEMPMTLLGWRQVF